MAKTKSERVPWTAEDNARLLQNWEHAAREELLAMFPGRDMSCLGAQIKALRKQGFSVPHRSKDTRKKYSRNMWSDVETEILIQNYPTMPQAELLALLPGRDWGSCANRVHKLRTNGVNIPPRTVERATDWTEAETRILVENWSSTTIGGLLTKLPGRTAQECSDRVQHLKETGIAIPKRNRNLTVDRRTTCLSAYKRESQKAGPNDFTGVHKSRQDGKWIAAIAFYRKRYYIIGTENKTDAVAARQRINNALEPIFAELQCPTETCVSDNNSDVLNGIIARGRQIIENEIRQIRAEYNAKKH